MIALDFITIVSVGALGLLIIGAAGLLICRNTFRILLALAIAGAGVNVLLLLMGYRPNATAPILGFGPDGVTMVDPIPQVLVLTAIVIGVGVQALAISLLIKISHKYDTLDIRELKTRFERDIAVEQDLSPIPGSQSPAVAQNQESRP